jgi:hypothetical protein
MTVALCFTRISRIMASLLLIGLLGCSNTTPGDPKDTKDRSGRPGPTEDKRDKAGPKNPNGNPEIVKLTADEFGKEWMADKTATAKKYASGLLEISGLVSGLSIDINSNPITLIPCASDPDKGVTLLLSVVTKQKEPWAVVGPGQQITVRGKITKGGFDIPYLNEAEFINLGPNASVTLKGTDLGTEAVKDAKATEEKYKGKGVIVVGKVVRRNETKTTVFLDAGDNKLIMCWTLDVFGPALGTPLEEGKEARVYGKIITVRQTDMDIITMRDCIPILGKQ